MFTAHRPPCCARRCHPRRGRALARPARALLVAALAAGMIAPGLGALPRPLAAMGARTADAPKTDAPKTDAPKTGASQADATTAQPPAMPPEYVPDEVLVQFRPDLSVAARDALLARLGLRLKKPLGSPGAYVLGIDSGAAVPDVLTRLRAEAGVVRAEPNGLSRIPPLPSPPRLVR